MNHDKAMRIHKNIFSTNPSAALLRSPSGPVPRMSSLKRAALSSMAPPKTRLGGCVNFWQKLLSSSLVISTLKHFSDIVSDMPSGSTLSTFNYSDILSVPTEIWSSRLKTRRRRGEEVGKSMINSRDPHLASGEPNTDRVSKFFWEIYGNMVCWKSINISHRSGRLPGAYAFPGKTTRVFNRPHEVLEGFLTQISGSPGS